MSDKKADAPKLRAQWSREAGFDVVHMSRADVDNLSLEVGKTVLVDIRKTPLAGIARRSDIIAAYARQDDSGTARLAILRNDSKDVPNFVNVDMHTLTLDILSHPEFPRMVERASTCCNENMRTFAAENAILVKLDDGDGFRHWWDFVPSAEQVYTSTGDK